MNDERIKRILWVDDEKSILMMVSMLLKSYNYEIETVGSAKEALDILANDSNFDLVGTDLRMAKFDGLEMAKAIKQNYPEIPVIILSAHASDSAMKAATDLGVFAYITKPIKVEVLLETIENAISGA